jgi:hypothetical protein
MREDDLVTKDAEPTQQPPEPPTEETPPPFQPDPDIVTFRERGRREDPKEIWRSEDEKNG